MSARQRADSEASDAGAETPNSTVGNAEEDAEAAQSVVAAAAAALEADVVAAAAARTKRNRRLLNILRGSVFLSVCQHTSNVQSEPMLVRQLCGGDVVVASRMLGNTQAAVGLLALFVNQFGGKLSDSLGRRPFMFVGPIGNAIVGTIVFFNHTNLRVVLVCRIIKQIITTFSNTVVATAALTDFLEGQELAMGFAAYAAMYGLAVLVGPVIETQLLRLTGSPRYAYASLATLGTIQAIYQACLVPETLEPAKRRELDVAKAANVFGFLTLFRKGRDGLRKIVTTATFGMVSEGKNLVDVSQNLMSQRLGMSVVQNGNFLSSAALCYMLSGWYCTPFLLRTFTARKFSTIGNLFLLVGYFVHGARENMWLYWSALVLLAPGINGASGTALRAIAADKATAQGFGKGEFQGWCNNLRAIAGSACTFIYGQYYAWAERSGVYPGTVFWLCGLLGAAVPQLLLMLTSDEELGLKGKKKTKAAN